MLQDTISHVIYGSTEIQGSYIKFAKVMQEESESVNFLIQVFNTEAYTICQREAPETLDPPFTWLCLRI